MQDDYFEYVPMDDAFFEYLLSRLTDEGLDQLIEKFTAARAAARPTAG
jgi:hypothetical protein